MKRALCLSLRLYLCLLISIPSFSQTGFFCGYNPADSKDPFKDKICQFFGAVSDQEAIKTVEAILGKIGVKNSIRIVPCLKIKNCYAWFFNDATNPAQYILYDPVFLDKIKNGSAADWGAKCVLAHEVAHILFGHTFNAAGTSPALELEADEWSGYALYKLGVPEPRLLDGVNYYSEDVPSATHPPLADRRIAIQKGYQDAKREYLDSRSDDVPVAVLDAARKKYEAAMAADDNASKITLLTEAIALYPEYEDAFYYRAGAFNEQGEVDKALKDIDEAIRLDKEDGYNHFLKSKILVEKSSYALADGAILTALVLEPDNTTFLVQQANVKYMADEYVNAVNICNKILGTEDGNASAYHIRGNSYYYLKEYQKAVEDLSKAIDISPESSSHFWGRGDAYMGLGNYRAALADYEKARSMGADRERMTTLISEAKEKLAGDEGGFSGEFTKVWIEHDVTSGSEKGMYIYMNMDLYNLKGIRSEVAAYFHFEDGRPMQGVTNFETEDGNLAASVDLADVLYAAATFENHRLFIPYHVFDKLPYGETNLKFDVWIWGYQSGKPAFVCKTEYTRFIYSRK